MVGAGAGAAGWAGGAQLGALPGPPGWPCEYAGVKVGADGAAGWAGGADQFCELLP